MAIESIGATVKKDSVALGQVTDFVLPDDEAKEYEVTNLDDTREQFRLSQMNVGQEFTLTVRLDPEAPQLARGQSGSFEVQASKQTASSTNGKTWTFDAFVRLAGGATFDVTSTDGVQQTFTLRLTSEVVEVNEA